MGEYVTTSVRSNKSEIVYTVKELGENKYVCQTKYYTIAIRHCLNTYTISGFRSGQECSDIKEEVKQELALNQLDKLIPEALKIASHCSVPIGVLKTIEDDLFLRLNTFL